MTHDAPPTGSQRPGWHRHPEHAIVERYWDGAYWTGEHRFAADAAPPGEPEARDGELTRSGAQVAVAVCVVAAVLSSGLYLAHGTLELFVVAHLPLVLAGLCCPRAGLRIAVVLTGAMAYGFVDGFVLGFVTATRQSYFQLFTPWESGLVAGICIAVTSLLAVAAGWSLGWLLNR